MKPHAFVAMPFGTQPGHDGTPIDFNRVYTDYIRPSLVAAGLAVFRADEDIGAGGIGADMLQELLMADVVVADLTLDHPRVWYELGIRHALRTRDAILVQGPRSDPPFDIGADRRLRYHLKNGIPDPAALTADCRRLTALARATLAASHGRKANPVFSLLPHLREADWKTLLSPRNPFTTAYEAWAAHVETARRLLRPGDILVLAEETPNVALHIEGRMAAGDTLLALRHHEFALEQFDTVLAMAPDHRAARAGRIVCLGGLGRYDQARTAARNLIADHPDDAEAWALAGGVEKHDWIGRWWQDGDDPGAPRERARQEDAVLGVAIGCYRRAFVADPAHHRAGLNALTLERLRGHLGGETAPGAIAQLAGGVRWAGLSAQARNQQDYQAHASCAALSLLVDDADEVIRAYRCAVMAATGDWLALDAIRRALCLLRALAYRPAETAAALDLVADGIARSTPPYMPRRVFLFSGHMADAPERGTPRFPRSKERTAAQRIASTLDTLGAGPGDLALTQGASGGDILFLEACAARGVRLHLMLPLAEAEFVDRSLLPANGGSEWRERYFRLKAGLADAPRILPDELGPPPQSVGDDSENPFERCNRWLLCTALAWGIDKVHFICLWDGGGGDGPGGTAHMYREVKRRTGKVSWIDTRTL